MYSPKIDTPPPTQAPLRHTRIRTPHTAIPQIKREVQQIRRIAITQTQVLRSLVIETLQAEEMLQRTLCCDGGIKLFLLQDEQNCNASEIKNFFSDLECRGGIRGRHTRGGRTSRCGCAIG